MRKLISVLVVLFFLLTAAYYADAQCSICTRTTQQLGERPAKALNAGIVYLAAAPLAICGFIGYRWWKNNQEN